MTVVVPTRDRVELLSACIDSLWAETDYPTDKLEVVVVDNGSEGQSTAQYLEVGASTRKLRVVADPMPFNYARLNNLAVNTSAAGLIVLLNNDTVIQDRSWLRRLASYAIQPDVGAVGPKLLFEDGTIQHAGVVLSVGGVAVHAHLGIDHDAPGAMGLAQLTHEVAAVTGACLAIRRSVYHEVGGLDEKLPIAFNDVLLCLACLDRGYRNIYVHDVWVRHAESKSRGIDDTHEKMEVFLREARYARTRYPALFKCDPYYNPNLSLATQTIYRPAFPPRCRKPWREYAARTRRAPKLLMLTGSVSDRDDIGPIVTMQARYLADQGYDVVVGGPKAMGSADIGRARQITLERSEAAVVYAVQNDVDCVIVHTWPFMTVARLLGPFPRTVLYDHGTGGQALTPSSDERWDAYVQHVLSLEAFDMVLASSPVIAERIGRDDSVVCPPGVDRLGRWSLAVAPLRDQVRRTFGLRDRCFIVVGGLPGNQDNARLILDRLAVLATRLNSEECVWAVIADVHRSGLGGWLVLPRLTPEELTGLYTATDLYLDVSFPDCLNLAACEARALGARVFRLDVEATYGDGNGSEAAARLSTAISEINRVDGWSRRTLGSGWGDMLPRFHSAIGGLDRPDESSPLSCLGSTPQRRANKHQDSPAKENDT